MENINTNASNKYTDKSNHNELADHLMAYQLQNQFNDDSLNFFDFRNNDNNINNSNNNYLRNFSRINGMNNIDNNMNNNMRFLHIDYEDDNHLYDDNEDEPKNNHFNDSYIFEELPETELKNVSKIESSLQKCLICLEKFEENDKVIILPCLHFFHSNCIKKWINVKNFCPIDKYVISKKSKVNSNSFEREFSILDSYNEEVFNDSLILYRNAMSNYRRNRSNNRINNDANYYSGYINNNIENNNIGNNNNIINSIDNNNNNEDDDANHNNNKVSTSKYCIQVSTNDQDSFIHYKRDMDNNMGNNINNNIINITNNYIGNNINNDINDNREINKNKISITVKNWDIKSFTPNNLAMNDNVQKHYNNLENNINNQENININHINNINNNINNYTYNNTENKTNNYKGNNTVNNIINDMDYNRNINNDNNINSNNETDKNKISITVKNWSLKDFIPYEQRMNEYIEKHDKNNNNKINNH